MADVAGAIRDNSEVLVGMADQHFKKTMAAAKGELDRKHQLFEGLGKPLSSGYERLNRRSSSWPRRCSRSRRRPRSCRALCRTTGGSGSGARFSFAASSKWWGWLGTATSSSSRPARDRGRPDIVVKLPNGRVVVVDAKASTAAFLEARTASDEAAAKDAWADTRRRRGSRSTLSPKKNYGASVADAVDFVVMFVSGDQFLSAALEVAPDLVAHGMRKRVAIATPASLIALLWAVAHGWQQVDVTRNAKGNPGERAGAARKRAALRSQEPADRQGARSVDARRSFGAFCVLANAIDQQPAPRPWRVRLQRRC